MKSLVDNWEWLCAGILIGMMIFATLKVVIEILVLSKKDPREEAEYRLKRELAKRKDSNNRVYPPRPEAPPNLEIRE